MRARNNFSGSSSQKLPISVVVVGYGWGHQWAAKLDISSNKITLQQSDGRGEPFVLQNNLWQGDADTQLALTQDSTGYTLSNNNGIVERYDLDGYLLSKTDLTGKQTQYSYNTEHQLNTLTSPFGHTLQIAEMFESSLPILKEQN